MRWGVLAPAALVLALVHVVAVNAQSTTLSATDLADRAWRMASSGELESLWQQIEQLPVDRPQMVGLKQQVRLYQQNEDQRHAQRRHAFDEALAELQEHVEAGRWPKALTSAVDAHGLSEDPDAFLQDRPVRALVDEAERAAQQAEQQGRWFESLVLYRRLDLLYDDHDTYREDLRRVSRQLRLLRMYVPRAYYQQSDDYARSQGDEPDERWAGDEDNGWQEDLAGIDSQMLVQAMTRAADRHVENVAMDKLFVGGIDALRAVIRNPALAEPFPGLGDAAQVQAFDRRLLELRRRIEGPVRLMGYGDAASRFNTLMDYNRQTVKLPERVVIHEFADGAMNQLDDFSSIIWPSAMEPFERTTKQEFSGVGIQITLTDGELTVVSPLEGTPAHRAGLRAGDRIVTIDGKSTVGIALTQAVHAITGKEGSTVTLGIQSPGKEKVRDVNLTRKTIQIHSVKGFSRLPGGLWDYWIDADSRVGYVRITQFGPQTASELDTAVAHMRFDNAVKLLSESGVRPTDIATIVTTRSLDGAHPGVGVQLGREGRERLADMLAEPRTIHGLVVDLRFNPGGLLQTAVQVADRFIPSDIDGDGQDYDADGEPEEIIVAGHASLEGFNAWRAYSESDDERTYPMFPMVVLVNQGSASASEIVAGCVQDHGRALIVGERTYGKGSVQQLFPLKMSLNRPRAQAKITTQYYKLPSGRIIHRRPDASTWGVEPDVTVRMTDLQVERLIKARMVIDVLRSDDEAVDPASVVGAGDDDEVAEDPNDPLPETASEALQRGYDPQLQTAVLLLKARLLDDLIAGE